MRKKILEKAAIDLLSITPLIHRSTRRKLIRSTFGDMHIAITPHHLEIIRLLEEEGTLYIGEIGERLQISKAQMTQLIDKLVDLNIVERKAAKSDRRVINIALTDYGMAILEEHKNNIKTGVRETMSCLTNEDLECLSDSLRKVQEILSKL